MFVRLICLASLLVLSACGNPLQDVERLSDVDVAADAAAADAVASADDTGDAEGFVPRTVREQTGGRGLLELFRRPAGERRQEAGGPEGTAGADEVRVAAEATPRRWGLFGNRQPAARTGPDALDIEPGTTLPFGQIARVCGVDRQRMGTVVDSYPDARARYQIHDPVPNSTAPRTLFITGFADRCPRQITAAVATFGSAASHELFRYAVAPNRPYSGPDTAYEQIKREVCGVTQGQPCGDRIGQLEQQLVFVSAYGAFGQSSGGVEFLLNDGAVVAADRIAE